MSPKNKVWWTRTNHTKSRFALREDALNKDLHKITTYLNSPFFGNNLRSYDIDSVQNCIGDDKNSMTQNFPYLKTGKRICMKKPNCHSITINAQCAKILKNTYFGFIFSFHENLKILYHYGPYRKRKGG